jgi:CRP/FNR family cyclic AMP-dependent transcriptional regulator
MQPRFDIHSLESLPLLADLPLENKEILRGKLHRKTFPRGAAIILAEQRSHVVYIIQSGLVKVYAGSSSLSTVLLGILGPGEIIGEIHALDNLGHSADVIVAQDSSCWWIDVEDFTHCVTTMPQLALNFLRLTAKRLRLSTEKIALLSTQDTTGRVARQLLILASQCGVAMPDGSIEIKIPLTQSDLAALTGCSRQSVNQALSLFRKRGDLSCISTQHLVIHRPTALAHRGA